MGCECLEFFYDKFFFDWVDCEKVWWGYGMFILGYREVYGWSVRIIVGKGN